MRSNDIIGWIHLSLPFVICAAVTPDTVIELFASNNSDLSVPTLSTLASKALFGPHLHFGKPSSYNDASIPLPIRLPPDDNQLLCDAPSSDATTSFSGTILLIPKGGCTYQRKVYHAQLLGAKHAIIHATLADKYRSPMQTFMSEKATTYPTQDVDYDCENGRSYIPETEIKFDTFPYDPANDDLLTGSVEDNNLCALYHNLKQPPEETRFENICQSQRCVFTSRKIFDSNKLIFLRESCCAWDLYALMGNDASHVEVNIASTFLTMEEGDNVLRLLEDDNFVSAIVYTRQYPLVNLSSVLITFMAIAIICISSRMSTREYRNLQKKLENITVVSDDENREDLESPPMMNIVAIGGNERNELDEVGNVFGDEVPISSNDADLLNNIVDNNVEAGDEPISPTDSISQGEIDNNIVAAEEPIVSNAVSSRDDDSVPQHVGAPQENNVAPLGIERNFENAREEENNWFQYRLGRIREKFPPYVLQLVASTAVLGLAFIILTRLLDVLLLCYGIGGSFSITYLLRRSRCQAVSDRMNFLKPCRKRLYEPKYVEPLDILTILVGLGAGITWLYYAFSETMAQSHPFYWVMQDLMNIAICIVIICTIRWKSIRVPFVILAMVFIYDTVVLLSPAIFQDPDSYDDGFEAIPSIETDYYRCDKYPDRKNELRCNPMKLPLKFLIPRANDYRGGWSSLSVAEVLLPGLALSIIARYDTAKSIIKALKVRERAARREIRNLRNLMPNKKKGLRRFFSGYLYQAIIGYIIALVISSAVMAFTRYKQVAMLYIFPLTVAPIILSGEFASLWSGPKRFRLTNLLMLLIAQGGLAAIDNFGLDDGDDGDTFVTRSIISFSDSEKEWSDDEDEKHENVEESGRVLQNHGSIIE